MNKAILGVAAVCVLAALGAFLLWARAPNSTILRNSSGAEITNAHLSVQSLDGTKTLSKKAEKIGAGESLVLRHSLTDSRATVSFRLEGKQHRYARNYVDLWTGEGWILEIMPDGSVQSGYRSTKEQGSD